MTASNKLTTWYRNHAQVVGWGSVAAMLPWIFISQDFSNLAAASGLLVLGWIAAVNLPVFRAALLFIAALIVLTMVWVYRQQVAAVLLTPFYLAGQVLVATPSGVLIAGAVLVGAWMIARAIRRRAP